MRFVEGFLALFAIAVGMAFAAFNFVMSWFMQTAMLVGAGAIIVLDVLALLVWFVNWRYYPEN